MTSKLLFEEVRGWGKGAEVEGMGCAKTEGWRGAVGEWKHTDITPVSCLRIWNKTLESEEVFQVV